MYMVRHMTQSPLSLHAISKAEGIPYRQLASIFRILSEAGVVAPSPSDPSRYQFKKPPSQVSLLEVFERVEGYPLFDECFMKHADCPGTPDNCIIYASWRQATGVIAKKLAEISIDKAAWGHPEHTFQSCCIGIEIDEEETPDDRV